MTNPKRDLSHRLGEVVLSWSVIAGLQERLFSQLTGITDQFVLGVIFKRLKDRQLQDALSELAGSLPEDRRNLVRAWLRRVGDLREVRNDLLHGQINNFFAVSEPLSRKVIAAIRKRVVDKQNGTAHFTTTEVTEESLIRFCAQADSLTLDYLLMIEDDPYADEPN